MDLSADKGNVPASAEQPKNAQQEMSAVLKSRLVSLAKAKVQLGRLPADAAVLRKHLPKTLKSSFPLPGIRSNVGSGLAQDTPAALGLNKAAPLPPISSASRRARFQETEQKPSKKVADAYSFIKATKMSEFEGFVYLRPMKHATQNSQQHSTRNLYDLEIVNYEDLDKSTWFATLSKQVRRFDLPGSERSNYFIGSDIH